MSDKKRKLLEKILKDKIGKGTEGYINLGNDIGSRDNLFEKKAMFIKPLPEGLLDDDKDKDKK